MIQCKRLHLAQINVNPLAFLATLALVLLLMLWFGDRVVRPAPPVVAPVKAVAEQPDRYLGTWQITDPSTRRKQGISFLMIAHDAPASSNYVVESARDREVFRYRDGRLINDTVTILYDSTRDTIRHSNFGELARKPVK